MDATDHTFVRTLTHFQEAMQRMRQLEDENRDLSRQVKVLERQVGVPSASDRGVFSQLIVAYSA